MYVYNTIMLQANAGKPLSIAVPGLNEKILMHNVVLTSFISQVSDEKADLRLQILSLEEDNWRYRQKEATFTQVSVLFCIKACHWLIP